MCGRNNEVSGWIAFGYVGTKYKLFIWITEWNINNLISTWCNQLLVESFNHRRNESTKRTPSGISPSSGPSCSKALFIANSGLTFQPMVLFPTLQRRKWAASLELTSFIIWKSKQCFKWIVHLFLKKKLLLEFSLNPGLKLTRLWTTQG